MPDLMALQLPRQHEHVIAEMMMICLESRRLDAPGGK